MAYRIKEIFYSLQGEGFHAGRPAVFCRFAGCNLWSGREADRPQARCRFCDTDFVTADGEEDAFASAEELARAIHSKWPQSAPPDLPKFVVCTGGEPLLQLDDDLVDVLQRLGFCVAVETNGTLPPARGIDWLTVSPKAGVELALREGNELKLVFPQPGAEPERYRHLRFAHFFLQPMDGPLREDHTRAAVHYCLEHPQWKLSLQLHKYLGIR